MKTIQHTLCSALLLTAGLLASTSSRAVALTAATDPAPFADTTLPGTTAASRPELAGLVLEDKITPFSMGGLTGTVQNRVVRETVGGTLDFYWKINVESSEVLGAGVTAFQLCQFGYEHMIDGDWRSDGLGTVAPAMARRLNGTARPDGAVNFIFENPITAGNASRFFFLRTTATAYAETALFDQLCSGDGCISGISSTFAPAVPEPANHALMFAGLAVVGTLVHRRAVL